jgi:sugar-specific transcriptional regulator TrmB
MPDTRQYLMNLRALGLSEYEEKAYSALIKLGKSAASDISRESGVSYGKIYEVLASLERKGLVRVIPEKTKRFVADDPAKMTQLVDRKEKELDSLREDIKSLKQVYDVHEEEVVHSVKGKKNFYKIIRELKEPKTFKYMIKYTSETHPEWMRKDKALLKKGVDIKVLTRYDKETEKSVDKWLKVNPNIKKTRNTGVAIDIAEEQVIIAMIKSNVILSIKDKSFIEMMKNLFLNMYKNAEKLA